MHGPHPSSVSLTHCTHTHTHSPTLPSNIIALGDPDSVPTLMDLGKGEEDDEGKKERNGIPTLGPDILAEIWEEFVLNAPRYVVLLQHELW